MTVPSWQKAVFVLKSILATRVLRRTSTSTDEKKAEPRRRIEETSALIALTKRTRKKYQFCFLLSEETIIVIVLSFCLLKYDMDKRHEEKEAISKRTKHLNFL